MRRPDSILSQFGSKVNLFVITGHIAQTTGVNKSVSFAWWQQGAEFVVPRTTACYCNIFVYRQVISTLFGRRTLQYICNRNI